MLFLMFVFVNMGTVWGNSIVYAAFLERDGLAGLPWIFIFSAALSIVAIAAYTPFVDRIANDKLLNIIFAVETGGIILGLLLLELGYSDMAFSFLYVIGLAWLAVAGPHLITYTNEFYDIQTAKRMMPVIIAGYRVGAIVGGLSVFLLNYWLGDPRGVVTAWLAAHAVVMALVWLMPHLIKTQRPSVASTAAASAKKQRASPRPGSVQAYLDNLREGFRYTLKSPYLRWMVAGTLLLTILMPLLEYRASELFLRVYSDSPNPTGSISNFVGYLRGAGNIIVLPMLLFGVSRIIARLGVANATLIFPASNLVIVLGLIALQFSSGQASSGLTGDAAILIAASAAYLDRNVFRLTFWYPVEGLLYNAVPLRVKGRARAFVNGLVTPVGALLAGLLLLLPLVSTLWFVSGLMAILAVACLVSILTVRKFYSRALIKMLAEEDYSFLFSQEASDLSVTDPAALASLERRLEKSDDPEFAIFMARLIARIGGSAAAPILTRALTNAGTPYARAAIIDAMSAADMREEAVAQTFRHCLNDPDGRVRQSALSALAALNGPDDAALRQPALDALQDSNAAVRMEAFSILSQSGDFYQMRPAVDALDRLLNADNPHLQAQGMKILGQIANFRAMKTLSDFLEHPADSPRLEAMLAFASLPDDLLLTKMRAPEVLALMIRRLDDPVARVRQLALTVLNRIDSRKSQQAVVKVLNDASPDVRAAAVESLARAGKAIIPLVRPHLNAADPALRKMAAVVLSRVDRREFGPLIEEHINHNLQAIYRNHGYLQVMTPFASSTGVTLLQDTLREQNQNTLDEIFTLLAVQNGSQAIDVVVDSLYSSEARARSNALEALETFTSPQTAELMGPLFDPDAASARLAQLGEETWGITPLDANAVIDAFTANTGNAWRRAITVYALGEVWANERVGRGAGGQGSRWAGEQGRKGEREKGRKGARKRGERRVRASGLLAALDDESEDRTERRKPRSARRSRAIDPLAALDALDAEVQVSPAHLPTRPPAYLPKTQAEVEAIVRAAVDDPEAEVRQAARAAQRLMAGESIAEIRLAAYRARRAQGESVSQRTAAHQEEDAMLSSIEKIIFLKKVPFFQDMTIEQLKSLAALCEEEIFEEDQRIFNQGDPGGALYMVVSGKVGIEQEAKRKGSFIRLASLGANTYFGEMTLFDNSARSAAAVALQDTLTLSLRHEPLVALARQNSELSLKLINVLSQRLRDANQQVAALTRAKPRALHKLYDALD